MNTLNTILNETFGAGCIERVSALLSPIETPMTDDYIAYATAYAGGLAEALGPIEGNKPATLMMAVSFGLPNKTRYSAEEAAQLLLSGMALGKYAEVYVDELMVVGKVFEEYALTNPHPEEYVAIEEDLRRIGGEMMTRPGVMELLSELYDSAQTS